jgi:hypothetical protein
MSSEELYVSQDHTTTEYHLTPNGWTKGSFSVYGEKTAVVPPPANRVETCIEEVEDTSGWAPPIVSWKTIWESEEVPPEARNELKQKFPRPERATWTRFQKKRRSTKFD